MGDETMGIEQKSRSARRRALMWVVLCIGTYLLELMVVFSLDEHFWCVIQLKHHVGRLALWILRFIHSALPHRGLRPYSRKNMATVV